MQTRILLPVVLLVGIAIGAVAFPGSATGQVFVQDGPGFSSPRRWEFKVVTGPDETALNAAAAEGFDWVTTEVLPARGPGSTPTLVTILKRRKPVEAQPAKVAPESAPKTSSTNTAENAADAIVQFFKAQNASPGESKADEQVQLILRGGQTNAVGQALATPPVVKWEYRTSVQLSPRDMNKFGAEGWELICVTGPSDGNPQRIGYYKRPLRDAPGAAAIDPKSEGERPDNSQSDSQGPKAPTAPERQ